MSVERDTPLNSFTHASTAVSCEWVYQIADFTIYLANNAEGITDVRFLARKDAAPYIRSDSFSPSSILECAAEELREYFRGTKRVFSTPLSFTGTTFQRAVWEECAQTPYGEKRSYGQIAKAIGRRAASRAVGNALNRNRLPIFIPCHRVIATGGKIGGYAYGQDLKEQLLALEEQQMQKRITA